MLSYAFLRDEIIGQIDIYIRRYEAPDAHLPQIHPRQRNPQWAL